MSVKISEPYVVGEKPPALAYRFLDSNGVAINVSGFQATFTYQEQFGAPQTAAAVVSNGPAGEVTLVFTGSEFSTAGHYKARFWAGNGTNRYASTLIEFDVATSIGAVPNI